MVLIVCLAAFAVCALVIRTSRPRWTVWSGATLVLAAIAAVEALWHPWFALGCAIVALLSADAIAIRARQGRFFWEDRWLGLPLAVTIVACYLQLAAGAGPGVLGQVTLGVGMALIVSYMLCTMVRSIRNLPAYRRRRPVPEVTPVLERRTVTALLVGGPSHGRKMVIPVDSHGHPPLSLRASKPSLPAILDRTLPVDHEYYLQQCVQPDADPPAWLYRCDDDLPAGPDPAGAGQ